MQSLDIRSGIPGASGSAENLVLQLNVHDRMEALGLLYGVSGGVQIDITASRQSAENGLVDASFCDHNCRTTTHGQETGNYDCPAAFSLHKGLKVSTMAPAELLVRGIERTMQGIALANALIIENGMLANYFARSNIPPEVQQEIIAMLSRPPHEVNLFGGNPERHPEILAIIAACKERGFTVNLTTTGGRLMLDEEFRQAFLENPPDILASSADDFESVQQVKELAGLTTEDIEGRWKQMPASHGQQRKALEAAFVAKLAQQYPSFPKLLFNLVVHRGNLGYIEELIKELRRDFPKAVVNPYPSQSSFLPEEFRPVWQEKDIPLLEKFVDARIQEHLQLSPGIVRRLHYYLMLKAAFVTYRKQPTQLIRMLSGNGVWKCWETPGAGRYVKIGGSPEVYQDSARTAGGHLACFWNNKAITTREQVWEMSPEAIAGYILGGMKG